MTGSAALLALTECPTCRTAALRAGEAGIGCAACQTTYPSVGGLPWLYREPAIVLGEWRNRLTLYLEEFAAEERQTRADLADPALLKDSRARLERLADAYRGQRERVAELLRPLGLSPGAAPQATQIALGTRVPRHQDLHSYYVNLHRDWVWGAAENAQSAALVGRTLGALAGRRLLVLGAGAGRLAYDLNESLRPALTVALDVNPLLLLAAEQIARGGSLELYEFPLAPRTANDQALKRTLTAPAPAGLGLTFVFADALEAPFAAQSFDAVLTPWLIDILDEDVGRFACRINRLLRPGGRWVNFGSLAFPGRRARGRYAAEEVHALATAAGFEITDCVDETLPYMQSPASRHGRLETVHLFAADKRQRAPDEPPPPAPPAWLRDPQLPIPPTAELEVTALASRLQAFILALIDGKRSLNDIAQFVTEQKLLGPAEALAAVRSLLLRLAEEGARARHL